MAYLRRLYPVLKNGQAWPFFLLLARLASGPPGSAQQNLRARPLHPFKFVATDDIYRLPRPGKTRESQKLTRFPVNVLKENDMIIAIAGIIVAAVAYGIFVYNARNGARQVCPG